MGIYVSELSFTDEDIRRIIEEVYHKYKIRYGKSARIFICVYHDAEDRRLTSSNWIAKIIPDDTFIDYTISFNSDYRTHRMINMNKEFSIFEIMSLLEPGIKECKAFLKEIEQVHSLYESFLISKNEYGEDLRKACGKREKLIDKEINDIEHGGIQYDEYYWGAYNFCRSVYDLAWELWNDIKKGEKDAFLNWHYEKLHEECGKKYRNFYLASKKLQFKECEKINVD